MPKDTENVGQPPPRKSVPFTATGTTVVPVFRAIIAMPGSGSPKTPFFPRVPSGNTPRTWPATNISNMRLTAWRSALPRLTGKAPNQRITPAKNRYPKQLFFGHKINAARQLTTNYRRVKITDMIRCDNDSAGGRNVFHSINTTAKDKPKQPI